MQRIISILLLLAMLLALTACASPAAAPDAPPEESSPVDSETEETPEEAPPPEEESAVQQEPYEILDPTVMPEGGARDGVTYAAWDGIVEHLFFHPVVAYPELAFDGDAQDIGIDDYMVTVGEFNKILQSVYLLTQRSSLRPQDSILQYILVRILRRQLDKFLITISRFFYVINSQCQKTQPVRDLSAPRRTIKRNKQNIPALLIFTVIFIDLAYRIQRTYILNPAPINRICNFHRFPILLSYTASSPDTPASALFSPYIHTYPNYSPQKIC